jgi:hypothetical protein
VHLAVQARSLGSQRSDLNERPTLRRLLAPLAAIIARAAVHIVSKPARWLWQAICNKATGELLCKQL